MAELHPIGGITLQERHLKKMGNWGSASIIIKRVADILNAEPFLYGGTMRNWLWSVLGILEEFKEEDYDVILVTNASLQGALKVVSREFNTYPIQIVHEDTFRILGKGVKIDFKLAMGVQRAPIDFTVNAVFAPLRNIFAGRDAPVYIINLKDIEEKILHHISSFQMYPFHLVRGIRLVAEYGMKFHPDTLNLYKRSSSLVANIPEPLIHRELARAVNEGYERAVWAVFTTEFAHFCFPSLKTIRKRSDLWGAHAQKSQQLISLFNPQNKNKTAMEVRRFAPLSLLKKEFAPSGRNLLYSYFVASLLLPVSPTIALNDLVRLNFYPAERFIILSCISGAQSKQKVEDAHALVQPFLRAFNTIP